MICIWLIWGYGCRNQTPRSYAGKGRNHCYSRGIDTVGFKRKRPYPQIKNGGSWNGRRVRYFPEDQTIRSEMRNYTHAGEKPKITTSPNTTRSGKRRRRIDIANHRYSNKRTKPPSIGQEIGRLAKREKNGFPRLPNIGGGRGCKWAKKCCAYDAERRKVVEGDGFIVDK